ncbi:tyrosine-type recombinase/integrase [Paenibacillus elgii]|uniref:tyrosine-type recombinase/integrase n=1 Tax=Paenibacillus elgii TaxID=189691 RepID=UPI000248D04A|nr:tyrosine-type recombinase/integrase [Paenibacillus elgii]
MKKNKILASMNRYGQNKEHTKMDAYREEIEKDRWDVRNLGIPYNVSRAEYYLTFEKFDIAFRSLIKKYVQQRLFVQDSIKFCTAKNELVNLMPFVKFVALKYPKWIDFKALTRNDIEEYLEHLKSTPMRGNKDSNYKSKEPTDYYLWRMIGGLENFLYYIQRYEWPEAPELPIRKLIYQEDRPKLVPKKDEDYGYVSDYVWNQIIAKLDDMEPQYLPILLLLEATGYRLTEILYLKQDCLVDISGDYWVRSERTNSRYQNPMVPIKKDLAELIKESRRKVQEKFPAEKNPNNLLFLRYSGRKGLGKPFLQISILRYWDRFATSFNIVDENGKPFHFRANAFKHRFGLKIMRAGLNMAQVHQLIANVTSEMPMIYARKLQKELLQNKG